MTIPRNEYPRPQFVRDDWLCLNGPWGFEVDAGDSGISRGLLESELAQTITVPFCPESELSGIGNIDCLNAVWYRRDVEIPSEWAGRKVLLHFQAVNYDSTVWVNGQEVYRHRGGWVPFTIDLDGVAGPGETATIVLRARHDTRKPGPYGKQAMGVVTEGCKRMTGIWQTVWMEPVHTIYMKRPRITPDVANSCFRVNQPISNNSAGLTLKVTLLWDGDVLTTVEVPADRDFAPSLDLVVPEDQVHLWGPGEGNLYDITLELIDADGTVVDKAAVYAGLRSVTIDGMAVKINGKKVFQRLVLDQGQYTETLYTAPTDELLRKDIELAMAAGFNGGRFHEKVFEERSLYYADKLGYLVWGEFGDWGHSATNPPMDMITQWLIELDRDYNHPCIIGWCGLNETVMPLDDTIQPLDDMTQAMFHAAKAMDTSRPVLDASGHAHRVVETDVWDSHDYDFHKDHAVWADHHAHLAEGKPFVNVPTWLNKIISLPYKGQPYFLSEFGGIWWYPRQVEGETTWGYGYRPETIEEFYKEFEFYCSKLLDDPLMFGYCYTQLTDTYPEQNGIFYQDRTEKFDMARIHAIQARPAAYEQAP
ncbi:MAG: glycoside hydrolase family 2 protein [Planctomycetota bacterium]